MIDRIQAFLEFLWADESAPVNSVMEYREREKRKRIKKLLKYTVILLVLIVLTVQIKKIVDNWQYTGYEVITNTTQEKYVAAHFTDFGENILKYGKDEIALLNRREEMLWAYSETMSNPVVNVCEGSCVVYDKKGISFSVFDIDGKIASVQTSLPILKADVSSQGVVAAILEDGDVTWVNVYNTEGELIVTSKTRMENPGYPLDISISSDGLLMAVSYITIGESQIVSKVAFYNFGNTGQNEEDNLVNSYSYEDILIPDVEYLDDIYAVAFSEDGFAIYKGKQNPEIQLDVKVDTEIMSVFYDESNIGLIVRRDKGEYAYEMQLYNLKGELQWSVPMEYLFDTVKISKDQILLYNRSSFAVYSMKGVCKYQGPMEDGSLESLFKIARNRYMVVLKDGIETLKLVKE